MDYGKSAEEIRQIGTARKSNQIRVMIWHVPRALSVAFYRAITTNPRNKPLFELYSKAYYVGADKSSTRYVEQPSWPGVSFSQMKAMYQAPYEDFDAVIGKDTGYSLRGKLDDCTWIPEGYTHTFIIRHPRKTVTSLVKICNDSNNSGGHNGFRKEEVGFEPLLRVFRLVTETLKQPTLVIDADDLLNKPEEYLREYCRRTGLEFCPEMLNWNLSPVDPRSLVDEQWYGWYEAALTAKFFRPPSISAQIPLPQEAEEAIAENLPLYEQLYKHRLVLEE